MLFVNPLKDYEIETLESMRKNHSQYLPRIRAHAILLSNSGYGIKETAKIFGVCRQAVSSWIKKWENLGVAGLIDQSRSGRPPTISSPEQKKQVIQIIEDNPRSIKKVLAEIEEKLGIKVSVSTIKRLCRKAGFIWKRVKRSLKGKRNNEEFEASKKLIEDLVKKENKGEIDLYYFDESGFNLEPCVPYAWQPKGENIELPCSNSARINVLGFINRDCKLEPFMVQGSVTSDVVIACFDEFSNTIKNETVVLIDNAPMHTSNKFTEHLEIWQERGLIVQNLARYSPELNIIEILWRKIKYEWMPFSAYKSFDNLKESLSNILQNVGGSDYFIDFA